MRIPLVDLARQHADIEAEVDEGFRRVIANSDFILGRAVTQFEEEFAKYCGNVKRCVGVGNGTDALELALRALDVGPKDEVIMPANTFIATALAAVRIGARPVLVDCDPETYLIDVDAIKPALSPRTRAVIPVHLYGRLADVDAVREAAGRLPIVEDAAQAHGASTGGRLAGSMGDVAAFSFYPGKNLGAYGDGGAIVTDDVALADRLAALRNWGSTVKYEHPVIGFNSRLDSIQAVVLRAKLRHLDRWNHERRTLASVYRELLGDLDRVVLPDFSDADENVWHLFVIKVPKRDEVLRRMQSDGIGVGVHYPKPLHLQPALADLGYGRGAFPVAESLAERILSLPMFPGLELSEVQQVVESLSRALQ